mgnify:CR=1 FL=1
MRFYHRKNGEWTDGTAYGRDKGEWVSSTQSSFDGDASGGFGWNQTFTDTSWLTDAGDDLNIEKVTSLDFNGSGGLSEAIDNAGDEPTVVVFEVGGVIEVPGQNWRIREEELWVAGETAPSPGITITQCRTRVHDPRVILSHLSFLQGDGIDEFDSTLDIDHRSSDVMVDHCTAGWGTEENIGLTREGSPTNSSQSYAERTSIINTILAEGLNDNDVHSDSNRARGFLAASEYHEKTCHMGCLYAHHVRRQPLMRCESVMCNNYVYNYGHRVSGSSGNIINLAAGSYEDQDHTWKGLHYEPGPDTPSSYDRPLVSYGGDVWYDDIVWDDDQRPFDDGGLTRVSSPPLLPSGLDLDTVKSAAETPSWVKANVGPRPADRSEYERELIENRVGNGQGAIIDSQDDVGGYPDYTPERRSLSVPENNILGWLQEFTDAVELGV